MTLSLDTAYRSFGGEVEASSTPTICRLPDSRRHQLSAIAPPRLKWKSGMALHRDIFWLGRQWAVTGYGIQAVNMKLDMKFDIEVSRLLEEGLAQPMLSERLGG